MRVFTGIGDDTDLLPGLAAVSVVTKGGPGMGKRIMSMVVYVSDRCSTYRAFTWH